MHHKILITKDDFKKGKDNTKLIMLITIMKGSQYWIQGRTNWRNCRLTIKPPDYQLGWAVLAVSPKAEFLFHVQKIFPTYHTVNIIDGLSTVPPPCYSLVDNMYQLKVGTVHICHFALVKKFIKGFCTPNNMFFLHFYRSVELNEIKKPWF